MSQRVTHARQLVAEGHSPSVVARVMQISRQAIYRTPKPRRSPQRRPASCEVERAIVEEAEKHPTDGYRLVREWVCRRLGRQVNRKRVLRVMREQRLIQRRRSEPRRRRPGFFRVQRPAQLWHMDMTSIWVAEHGWVYLNAIIDCCTREIVGWDLSLRCRAKEAIAVIEQAVAGQAITPGTLTLGTDNGENGRRSWPHRGRLIWPHLVRPRVDRFAFIEREREAGRRSAIQGGVVRADQARPRR